jgi:O-antigen/teichoic acid export membrane protein
MLMRRIITTSMQLTVASALVRALSVLSLPLLTHYLSPASYGQAALASTLISLASVIGLMGLDMSYARTYLSHNGPSGKAVETYCWRLALPAAVLAGALAAAIWLLHAWRDPVAMASLAWWIFVGTVMSLLMAMSQTRARLKERYTRLTIAVLGGGITAVLISLLLSMGPLPDERALVISYVAAYLVPVVIMGLPSCRQLLSPSGLDVASQWQVFKVGLPGVVTAPLYWIISSSDRWFLQANFDAETVGVFAVACAFGQVGMMVNTALLALWLPEAARLHENGAANSNQTLSIIMVRLVSTMAITMLFVGILGGDVMRLLTEEKFQLAAVYIPWIAAGVFFYGCYHLANTGLFLSRGLKWTALLWTGVGLISIIGNALLVPQYGMIAAAIMQCVSFAFLALIVMATAQKHHPLPLPFGRLFGLVALVVLVLWLGQSLSSIEGFEAILFKFGLIVAASLAIAMITEPSIFRMIWHVSGVRSKK